MKYNIDSITYFLFISMYSETWELWTPKGLENTVLNSGVVLILRSISMYCMGLGTDVAVLNSYAVPISQMVLKTGFTVFTLIRPVTCRYSTMAHSDV